jgi:hypothetical protein
MAQSRLGLNFICDAPNFDFDKARAIIDKLRPRWIVVINGMSFAKEIAVKYPEVNVIVRWVADDDDTRARWPKPIDFVAFARREIGDARLFCNVTNENGFSGDLLKYTIDVIDQSGDLRLAVGGYSVGTPEPADWRVPLAIELLKRLDTQRNRLVLNLHEYYPVLPIGMMDGVDHANPNMAAWPTDIRGHKCWLAGRYQFLIQACQALEIGAPRIVIGEHEADRIDQYKAWMESLIKTPPYAEIRGWRTLRNQYRAWYNKDAEYVLLDFARYSDKVIYYHPAVEGIVPFAACSEESEWNGFNLMDADVFIQSLADYANENVAPPSPPARRYEPGAYVYSGANSFNIRVDAGEVSASIGKLTKDCTVNVLDEEAKQPDKHLWQKVTVIPSVGDNLLIFGWVAVDIIPLTPKPAAPPMEPPAPPAPIIALFTRAELEALAQHHEAMAAILRTAAGRAAA